MIRRFRYVAALALLLTALGAGPARAAATCTFDAGVLSVVADGSEVALNLRAAMPSAVTEQGVVTATCDAAATPATLTRIVLRKSTAGGSLALVSDFALTGRGGTEADGVDEIEVDMQTRATPASSTLDAVYGLRLQAVPSAVRARLGFDGSVPANPRRVVDLYTATGAPDRDVDVSIDGGPATASTFVVTPANDEIDFTGYTDAATAAVYPPLVAGFDVSPGAGADTIVGAPTTYGSPGDDTLSAPACASAPNVPRTLRWDSAPQAVSIRPDFAGTTAGGDGYGGTDTFAASFAGCAYLAVYGTPQADTIYGRPTGASADSLFGVDGGDTLVAGSGPTALSGAGGDDTLRGGPRNDTLDAGEGADDLAGGGGTDVLNAGNGADVVAGLDGAGGDLVLCGAGVDTGSRDRADTANSCEFGPPVVNVAGPAGPVAEGTTPSVTVTLSGGPLTIPIMGGLTLGAGAAGPDGRTFVPYTIAAGETTVAVAIAIPDDDEAEAARGYVYTDAEVSPTPARGTSGTLTVAADGDVPGIAISTTPDAEDGSGGFFRAATARVTATRAQGGRVRCVVDPPAVPTGWSDLPDAPCPDQTVPEGRHTVYAAVRAANDVDSMLATRSVAVDGTAPAMACDPVATVPVGTAATVGAAVSDATSGPEATRVTAPVDTATPGTRTVLLSGRDRAGNVATAACSAEVVPAATPPGSGPSPGPAAPVALFCNGVRVVAQPVLVGSRVRVTGLARTELAGRGLVLLDGRRTVGRGTVGRDGRFTVTAPAPPRSRRSTVRYRVQVGTARSAEYLLQRRTVVKGVSASELSGVITASRKLLPRTAELFRQTTCTTRTKVADVKLDAAGRFRLSLQRATAATGPLIFRVRVKLRNGRVSFTVPITVLPTA